MGDVVERPKVEVEMKGVNPKAWFYGLRDNLQDREDHVRRVLAGSAAEQWLNGEFFQYLSQELPENLTAYPEAEKRDLTVFEWDKASASEGEAKAAIELKLVYVRQTRSARRERIRTLLGQMDDTRNAGIPSFGWIFAVYAFWESEPRKERLGTFSEFRRDVGATLNEELEELTRSKRITLGKPALETIVDVADVSIGGARATVGMAAQHLRVQ